VEPACARARPRRASRARVQARLLERALSLTRSGGTTAARTRLETLDSWLDQQEKDGLPLSEHALLTHVVDEIGASCGELQGGFEGTDEVPAVGQPEAAQ